MLGLCWGCAGFVLGLCWVCAANRLQPAAQTQHKLSNHWLVRHLQNSVERVSR
jgi:hypothetical protein